jgi:hypothetical protein
MSIDLSNPEPQVRSWCRITVGSHAEFAALRGELLRHSHEEAVSRSLTPAVAVFACGLLTDGFYQVYFSPGARDVFVALLEGRRVVSCPPSQHATTPTAQFIIGDATVFDLA